MSPIPRRDSHRSDATPDLVLIPTLPSLVRVEVERRIARAATLGEVIGASASGTSRLPRPAGGGCRCSRVAISLHGRTRQPSRHPRRRDAGHAAAGSRSTTAHRRPPR